MSAAICRFALILTACISIVIGQACRQTPVQCIEMLGTYVPCHGMTMVPPTGNVALAICTPFFLQTMGVTLNGRGDGIKDIYASSRARSEVFHDSYRQD